MLECHIVSPVVIFCAQCLERTRAIRACGRPACADRALDSPSCTPLPIRRMPARFVPQRWTLPQVINASIRMIMHSGIHSYQRSFWILCKEGAARTRYSSPVCHFCACLLSSSHPATLRALLCDSPSTRFSYCRQSYVRSGSFTVRGRPSPLHIASARGFTARTVAAGTTYAVYDTIFIGNVLALRQLRSR